MKKTFYWVVGVCFGFVALISSAQLPPDSRFAGQQPSRMIKVNRLKTLLKLSSDPIGLSTSLTLTINRAYVKNKGSLKLQNFDIVQFEEPDGVASGPGDVILRLNVAKPGKPHLITYYFNSSTGQEARVSKLPDPEVKFQVQPGPQTISFAYIPAKAGIDQIMMEMSKRYVFSKLEVDVVN